VAPPREPAFGLGIGSITLLSGDADFRMTGLLLTGRVRIAGDLEGQLSSGIFPGRIRTGAAGRYSIHVLPLSAALSLPIPFAPLRLGIGVQAINASVAFATTELDSASAWTVGPLAQLEARLPVGRSWSIHLGAAVAWQPFREQVETGDAVVFGYPRWTALATASVELNLYR
jgi:hypothetical protein